MTHSIDNAFGRLDRRPHREAGPKSGKISRLRLPDAEFIAVLHQLELQLRAGVTADAALRQLAEDSPKGAARTMLTRIHMEVMRGVPINRACRYFVRQFPPHVAAVIAAGEEAARLPESLRALADSTAEAVELRKTARRALVYPVIVLGATGALVIFLMGGVVPKFAAIFGSLRIELPALTVGLIRASQLLRDWWLILIAGAVAVVGLATAAPRVPALRLGRDRALLVVPVIGETIRCLCTARFAAHCRLLHEAGIPLLEALQTGSELMRNAVLEAQLKRARVSVAAGRPLYASLPRDHDFPGFIVPALKSGETTGQLGAALKHIEAYAAARARERIATALALMEPLLLSVLTVVVGGIALSFFLPLFSLLGGLNSR